MYIAKLRHLIVLLILLSISGCSSDGPTRYRLQGAVTYDGKPVPAGTIIFEPDSSQKNDGPQGLATIHNGIFDTAKGGKGTVGGPHRITILGCDGANISETSPQGKPLFEPFITTADLPRKNGKYDFDVPAAKAARTK